MKLALFIALLASATVLLACPDDEPKRCFLGDPSAAPRIEPVYRDVAATMQPLSEGGQVPLILPPQGGKVMFIGVRAQNLDGCPLTLSAALRDPSTGAVIALERRPVQLEPGDDGWLSPLQPMELSNYSNLPACPRANIERDIHGQPYELLIQVEDKDGRTAETSLNVIPTCAEPEFMERCLCECRLDYRLGDDCSGALHDAGTSTASASDGG